MRCERLVYYGETALLVLFYSVEEELESCEFGINFCFV